MVATKNQSCLLDYSPQNKYGTQEWFGLEDDFPFQTSDFACSTLVFQGCFSMSSCSQRLPMFCFHCSEDVHRTRQVPPIWGLTALPLVSPVVLSRDLPDPKKKTPGHRHGASFTFGRCFGIVGTSSCMVKDTNTWDIFFSEEAVARGCEGCEF